MTEGNNQLFIREDSSLRCLSEKLRPHERFNLKVAILDYKKINGGYHTDALAHLHFVRHLMPDGYRFLNWCSLKYAEDRIPEDPGNLSMVDDKGKPVTLTDGIIKVALIRRIPRHTPVMPGGHSSQLQTSQSLCLSACA